MTEQTPDHRAGDPEHEPDGDEYDAYDPDAGINPVVVPAVAAAREPDQVLDEDADDLDDFDGGF